MNVSDPGASRPNYYDRNPLDVVEGYNAAGVAPHVLTTRWTYTVPANRKAYIEAAVARLVEDAAGSAAGFAQIAITVGPVAGGGAHISDAWLYTFAAFDHDYSNLTNAGLLQAGDALLAITQDASTGGTKRYKADCKITEFDA